MKMVMASTDWFIPPSEGKLKIPLGRKESEGTHHSDKKWTQLAFLFLPYHKTDLKKLAGMAPVDQKRKKTEIFMDKFPHDHYL